MTRTLIKSIIVCCPQWTQQRGVVTLSLETVADVDVGRAGHAGELVGAEVDDDLTRTGAVSGQRHRVWHLFLSTNRFPVKVKVRSKYYSVYILLIIIILKYDVHVGVSYLKVLLEIDDVWSCDAMAFNVQLAAVELFVEWVCELDYQFKLFTKSNLIRVLKQRHQHSVTLSNCYSKP